MTDTAGIEIDYDVPADMRDGVVLRANVYRPKGDGPWPTLLTRTPYGKDDPSQFLASGIDAAHAARTGFMVVIQDTRGRFASEGNWRPFRHEREDGYDTVQWAASLPGSTGRIGMFGGSYCGNTQWMPAIDNPPNLVAIAPLMTWADPFDGLFARGGAVELGLVLPWSIQTGLHQLLRTAGNDLPANAVDNLINEWDCLNQSAYWDLPVSAAEVLRRHGITDLGSLSVLADPAVAEWCTVRDSQRFASVPSLHTGGWYDVFLQGTLDNYIAAHAGGHDASLLVGPWTHERFTDPVGQAMFGLRAARNGVGAHPDGDWSDVQLAWLRTHLGRQPDEPQSRAPVRIFVMGRNEWRDEQSWPPANTVDHAWYLGPDSRLQPTRPTSASKPSRFTYNPADPVPTVGGHTVMWPAYVAGPADQRGIEERNDVLVFTSAPFAEDLEVTGRVRMVLHARSSAPATDWVARLCDVAPDGLSINLCDGILRVTEGANDWRQYEIDLWSTSNVFLRGHRLRVHVTSSSFPRWDRNMNTGQQGDRHHVAAHQEIGRGQANPSHVLLPVVLG